MKINDINLNESKVSLNFTVPFKQILITHERKDTDWSDLKETIPGFKINWHYENKIHSQAKFLKRDNNKLFRRKV